MELIRHHGGGKKKTCDAKMGFPSPPLGHFSRNAPCRRNWPLTIPRNHAFARSLSSFTASKKKIFTPTRLLSGVWSPSASLGQNQDLYKKGLDWRGWVSSCLHLPRQICEIGRAFTDKACIAQIGNSPVAVSLHGKLSEQCRARSQHGDDWVDYCHASSNRAENEALVASQTNTNLIMS